MKTIVLSLLLCLFSIASLMSQDNQVVAINNNFDKYKTALLANDYKTVVDMIHPRIVELGGGPAYMMEDVEQDVNMYKAVGVSIIDVVAKQPSMIVEAGTELHAMLPVEYVVQTPVDTTREANFILVASQDQGKSWYFIDMRKQDEKSIKEFLPFYNTRLNFFLRSND